ncbi:MAG: hypothetical protein VYB22_00035 [Pseudomonadota bacterium]|nr:hypothetical protein [Pseudomonadota bacterium]
MTARLHRRPDWHRECLVAANRQLEKSYQSNPSACVALQISRNYRLLLTHYDQPDIKELWQHLSQRWWAMYCRHKHLPLYSQHDISLSIN